MSDPLIDSCWRVLCLLKDAVRDFEQQFHFCSLRIGTQEAVLLNDMVPTCCGNHIITISLCEKNRQDEVSHLLHLSIVTEETLPPNVYDILALYTPYCLLPLYAKNWQRAFAVSHCAQSLDGHIATVSGDSKWIGNDENLIHAHRMRALCDGVLIGKNTLLYDSPQLTVRHVNGKNPTRIVIGACPQETGSLLHADAPILLINKFPQMDSPQIPTLSLPAQNGNIATRDILAALYQRGIYSVYIEGGSTTISHFLQEKNIDILQLHIAPIILGSGINCFALPEIQKISAAIRFHCHIYKTIGDGVMFLGVVK